MAEDRLRIVLQMDGQGQVTAALQGVRSGLSQTQASIITLNQGLDLLGKGWALASQGIQLGARFLGDAIKASNEQENALKSLNQTLVSTGQYTAAYSQQLQDLATEFQNTTTFADEVVLSVERQLVAFGATPDVVKKATSAVLDLAASGKDLDASTQAVGKAIAGNFTALQKMGISVDENASKAQKLDQAFATLNQRVGGQAVAAAETFSGSLDQLGNQWDDFLEKIGDAVKRSDFAADALAALKKELIGLNNATADAADPMAQFAGDVLKKLALGAVDTALAVGHLIDFIVRLGETLNVVPITLLGKIFDDFNFDNQVTDWRALSHAIEGNLASISDLRARIESFGTDAPRQLGAVGAAAEGMGARVSHGVEQMSAAQKKAQDEDEKVRKKLDELSVALQNEAQKAIDDFAASVSKLDWEAQTAGMTDTQKALADLSRQYELARDKTIALDDGTGHLDQKLQALDDQLDRRVGNLVKVGAAAQQAAERTSTAASQIGDAFADAFEGIALGTRELDDIPGLFKDAFAKAFFDTIREKSGFDDLFKKNIFGLVGGIGDFVLSPDGLVGAFSKAFDFILGDKNAFDAAFSSGGIASLAVGGAGAAGGGLLGSKVGGTGGAIAGALLGKVLAEQGFSLATTGALTSGTVGAGGTIGGNAAIAALADQGLIHLAADSSGNIVIGLGPSGSSLAGGIAGAGGAVAGSLLASELGLQRGTSGEIGGAAGGGVGALAGLVIGGPVGALVGGLLGAFGGGSIGGAFTNVLSSGQVSRRFLGNELLGNTMAIGGLGDTLNFDPYKSGITSVQKAMAAFPDLFAKAGSAATAFGIALAHSVDSGQSDTKELNYIVETLIDNLGTAGVDGEEGVVRIAAAMKELGITTDQAGAAIQQAFEEGKIGFNEYAQAMAGLDELTGVTTQQVVDTLKAGLGDEARAVFDRLVAAGVDSFEAVMAAGNSAFVNIASGLQDGLLPNAVQVFELIRLNGIRAAEDVQRAFEAIAGTAAAHPEATSPTWFVGSSGKLVFGHVANGQFVNDPAPLLSAAEQKAARKTAIPISGSFALGGVVPGLIGDSTLVMAHAGETVLPTHNDDGLRRFARAIVAEMGGAKGAPIIVNLQVDGRTLARVNVPGYPRGLPV